MVAGANEKAIYVKPFGQHRTVPIAEVASLLQLYLRRRRVLLPNKAFMAVNHNLNGLLDNRMFSIKPEVGPRTHANCRERHEADFPKSAGPKDVSCKILFGAVNFEKI